MYLVLSACQVISRFFLSFHGFFAQLVPVSSLPVRFRPCPSPVSFLPVCACLSPFRLCRRDRAGLPARADQRRHAPGPALLTSARLADIK